MAHLSPSAIFSPSIARQQAAAAKDWNYIDSWLSSKFHNRTPPPFERNPDTLKALLALASINESADEERDLLCKVEAKALSELQAKESSNPHAELLGQLEQGLSKEGQTALQCLAELSTEVRLPLPSIPILGSRILDLQVTADELAQTSERISILENHLNTELESIQSLIKDLESESYQPPKELSKQTTDYQRKAKALAAKLPELRDRVAAGGGGGREKKITIQDVKAEEERFREMRATVRELEKRVKSYHGLPQDTDLARLELESLRVELRGLTRERDMMFEGLVERESPKKTRS